MAEPAQSPEDERARPTADVVLRSRIRVPGHVVYRTFPAETVVLNMRTGKYHGLNPVAGRMLEVATEAKRPKDVIAQFAREYGEGADRIERELGDLLMSLLERGLIELDAGS